MYVRGTKQIRFALLWVIEKTGNSKTWIGPVSTQTIQGNVNVLLFSWFHS